MAHYAKKLAQMLARNPMRMDYYKKYQEIIADYNREKDRATVEATFAQQLVALAASLDAEQKRAAEEGLTDDELALFDLLFKENISKRDRERLKQASQGLLTSLHGLLAPMPGWLQNVWVANYYSARNPLRLSSLVILGVVARMFRCATRSSCWCT